MTALDSRALTYVDCFGQKFAKPGTYRYAITTAAGATLGAEPRFTIEVRKASDQATGRQHDVSIRLVDRELVADPADLVIDAGDVVLWNTTESRVPGLAISGEARGDKFDSRRLTDLAIYTHAFGVPGHYEWRDAWGGKVGGVIEVRSPDTPDAKVADDWIRSLAQGTVVSVKGSEVKPKRVQIMTGQTIAWAIEGTRGVSITDLDLLVPGAMGATGSGRTASG